MGLKILAEDPLHKRLHHIASSVIHKPKQIPSRDIVPVIL